MRHWSLGSALVLIAAPLAAHAQVAPSVPAPDQTAQGDVSLTIYNNDLGLVQDKRVLTLATGRTRQVFPDVSAVIRAESVTLSGAGISVIEQNFDYDLLTPEKLMDKAVGQTVTLVRRDENGKETRETAIVLANNNGTVVQIGNRIEVLAPGTRVIFPSLPPNLRARPTLSVTIDSATSGPRPVTLNYLTAGLGWRADYVVLFDEAAGKMDVQGWVTLANTTGTTFTDANLLLVAGSPGSTQRSYRQPSPPGNTQGTESANRERLGDYYVYPLARRTTVANAQQKQVSFLDVAGAPATKAYYYYNDWLGATEDAASFSTVLRFSTSRNGGLGDALPAGIVRVYMRDARGVPQFIGESRIGHTPMGSNVAIRTGEAFDVRIVPVVEKRERLGDGKWRTTMRYRLTNARGAPVVAELAQGGLDSVWQDSRIESESQPSERINADEVLWKVTIPANGETVVTAVFITRF
ncbi:MAG: DUF4139 domain-containing protein [Sphingomonas sp.]